MDNQPVQEVIPVVFRVWKDSGEVIALFPTCPAHAHGTDCVSYMHVSGHAAASFTGLMLVTRPATKDEYADAKRELETVYDYKLKVYRHHPMAFYDMFAAEQERFNSLASQMLEPAEALVKPAPQALTVGMGATLIVGSDRHAFTIIRVMSDKRFVMQADIETRTDTNGMSESQTYRYERNPNGRVLTVFKRKNGRWRVVGTSDLYVSVGQRHAHYDFSR